MLEEKEKALGIAPDPDVHRWVGRVWGSAGPGSRLGSQGSGALRGTSSGLGCHLSEALPGAWVAWVRGLAWGLALLAWALIGPGPGLGTDQCGPGPQNARPPARSPPPPTLPAAS